MAQKVLTLLLGSPRKGGNTETLADALAEGAKEKGYEVRKVRLASMNLKGCLDCRKCWSTGKPCVQGDDMNEKVYPAIEVADVIVFVSPIYFFSWSTQIKPVWDRLLPFCATDARRTLKGKKAVLLSVAGDDNDEAFAGVRASFKIAVKFMGWEEAGNICAKGIYTKGEMAEMGTKYLTKAKELGRSL